MLYFVGHMGLEPLSAALGVRQVRVVAAILAAVLDEIYTYCIL